LPAESGAGPAPRHPWRRRRGRPRPATLDGGGAAGTCSWRTARGERTRQGPRRDFVANAADKGHVVSGPWRPCARCSGRGERRRQGSRCVGDLYRPVAGL